MKTVKVYGIHMKVKEVWGSEPDLLLVIVKHPLSWLPSIYRYRGKGTFKNYVSNSNEIELWNNRYKNWLKTLKEYTCVKGILKYEDLLVNPLLIRDYAQQANLIGKDRNFTVSDNWMGKHG